MEYSHDRQYIISGSRDHTIQIWDAENSTPVSNPLKGHTSSVLSVAYSPNGHHIISGSEDITIQIWNAETGIAVRNPLKGHTGSVQSVAYSPDGQHIISRSDDCTIQIWDAGTGAPVSDPLEGHTGLVLSVVYLRAWTQPCPTPCSSKYQLSLATQVEENTYIPEGWHPSPPTHCVNKSCQTCTPSTTKPVPWHHQTCAPSTTKPTLLVPPNLHP